MALVGLGALDLSGLGQIKSLLCTTVGLQLRHNGCSFRIVEIRLLAGFGGEEDGHHPALQLGGLIQIGGFGGMLGQTGPPAPRGAALWGGFCTRNSCFIIFATVGYKKGKPSN